MYIVHPRDNWLLHASYVRILFSSWLSHASCYLFCLVFFKSYLTHYKQIAWIYLRDSANSPLSFSLVLTLICFSCLFNAQTVYETVIFEKYYKPVLFCLYHSGLPDWSIKCSVLTSKCLSVNFVVTITYLKLAVICETKKQFKSHELHLHENRLRLQWWAATTYTKMKCESHINNIQPGISQNGFNNSKQAKSIAPTR